MLITFRSKASAEVMMYKEHAKRILDLLHKDAARGVITAAEAPRAVSILEREIAESRIHPVSDEVQHDINAHQGGADDDPDYKQEPVSFATRAFPLLEMLRAAKNGGCDVLW